MNSKSLFKLSVGSASEYEDLIAEILFPNNFGLIISQKRGVGVFDISVHSLRTGAECDFDYTKNVESAKVPLQVLNEAITAGIAELTKLARSANE